MNPANEPELDAIEATTQLELTGSFRRHLASLADYEPGTAESEISLAYPDGFVTTDVIVKFLNPGEICSQWEFISYLADFAREFELGPDLVETQYLIPFADTAAGGIYVSVGGRHVDSVYHSDNGDFGICRLAGSLDEFVQLQGLRGGE